jgi:FkbM family methyltransferase
VPSLISYAQNFEDVMLWRALKDVENGFYIDIGAQDPIVDSVSMAFYENGWRGIHVEPTPHYADLLRKERPEESVIQAAVGTSKGFVRFFEIPDSGISTADAAIAAQHVERGFKVHEITVPSISLASIFSLCKHREIHWLKIDVEGFESQVLSSWGRVAARPWIIVVESTLPLTQIESHAKWERHLVKRGYGYVYFDGLNRFYVSEQRPELKGAFRSGPNVFDGFVFNGTGSAPFWSLIEKRHQIELVEKLDANARQLQSQIQALEEARSKRELELEGKHNEVSSRLAQRDVEYSETRAQVEQLTVLLQTREFELSQAITSSDGFENALHESLLKVNELSEYREQNRAELLNITQQFIQNVARFGAELNIQIERNAALSSDVSAERIKAITANEALSVARTEAIHAKDFYAHREAEFSQNLAAEKARNELLEKSLHSAKANDELREIELAKYREINARQAEAMGKKDKHFALELNNYRERVSALEWQLRDEKALSESKVATFQAAANDAELAIERLTGRTKSLDEIVTNQLNRIHEIERQSNLDAQKHRLSACAAEEKIAELTHRGQLVSMQLAEQKHAMTQLNETLSQVRAELVRTLGTYSWKLTRPFRWAVSFLKRPWNSAQSSSSSASLVPQQPPDYKQPSLNELNMTQSVDEMRLSGSNLLQQPEFEPSSGDENFIKMCYQTSLGRAPDPKGAEFYLGRLKAGTSGASILDEIQESDEARAYSRKIGLPPGKGITVADAERMLAKQDKSFVVAAYHTLLYRSPDSEGYASYLMRLRSGVPKIQLLTDMRNSSEGQRYAVSGDGLTVFIRRYARSKMFFFGWLFRLFSRDHFSRPTQSMLISIENQLFAMEDENQERSSKVVSLLKHAEDANLATRQLIDEKLVEFADEIAARFLQVAEHTNKRLDNLDLKLARQNIVLQRRGIERRFELIESVIRNDPSVSAVFNELRLARASRKGAGNENSN